MFDLPISIVAVSPFYLVAGLVFLTVATFVITEIAYRHGLTDGHREAEREGISLGLGIADERGAYLDGFNDGLDAADDREAYLGGFEDGLGASEDF